MEGVLASPLIIDSDRRFVDSIRSESAFENVPGSVAINPDEAAALLRTRDYSYSGIFINPNIAPDLGAEVLRLSHEHQFGTPIFLVYDGTDAVFTSDQLSQLAVQRVFEKPLSYSEILRAVTLPKRPDGEIVEVELPEATGEFRPVRAMTFLSPGRVFFDLYLRLASGKMIKIHEKGDELDSDRMLAYFNKGVGIFYIPSDFQQDCLSYAGKLSQALLRKQADLRIARSHVLDLGDQTLHFLKEKGVSQKTLGPAMRFVQQLKQVAEKTLKGQAEEFESFFKDLPAYDHGVATAFIAQLLISVPRFRSLRMQTVGGMAALCHDIGLERHPHLKSFSEKREDMSPGECALYEKHPLIGASIFEKLRGLDPIVAQAILQHHETRDGLGFPYGLQSGQIHVVAEIVGISEMLAQLIAESKNKALFNPFEEIQTIMTRKFSFPVIEAFQDVFLRKY